MKFLLASLLFASSPAFATFLPPGTVVDLKQLSVGPSNTSEADFNAVLSQIQNSFAPIVTAQGGTLNMMPKWFDDTLNAGSNQLLGTWVIQVTGGLARRPELTTDGFTLIVCHEMGHHLGGYAFEKASNPLSGVWAANEGQADYFSTQVCPHIIWGADTAKNATFRQTATPEILKLCDRAWRSTDEQNLCYRVLTASESMAVTMASILKTAAPQFSTPDPSVVAKTNDEHPAVQCRMDTVLQGALCTAQFDKAVIPGKSVIAGPFSAEAERESSKYTCMALSNYSFGLRPACWFKSQL